MNKKKTAKIVNLGKLFMPKMDLLSSDATANPIEGNGCAKLRSAH